MNPAIADAGPHQLPRPGVCIRVVLLAALVPGFALAEGACSSDDAECSSDMQCGPTHACVDRGCVTRLGDESVVWALEVAPAADSPHAAREIPAFTFTKEPATLRLDRKLNVVATLSRPTGEGSVTPTSVNVTAAWPSSIAGRRNLTFEAQAVNQGGPTPYQLSLPVPERLLGQLAHLTVAPVAPLNRTLPPWWLDLPLTSTTSITLPGDEDALRLTGTVAIAPAGATPIEYEARVFVDDMLASNLARTDATGRFAIEVQRSWATRPGVTARVEIAVADATLPSPSLSLPMPSASGSLGTLAIPLHAPAVPIVVPVVEESSLRIVAGATVRFSAPIEGAVGADSRYVRTAQTGGDGKATVAILPSVMGRPLEYSVRVMPPADSESAPRCLTGYAVSMMSDGTRLGATIFLPSRVVLDGRVVRAEGRPAAGLKVRATRTGDLYNQDCGGPLASAPPETTTDAEGRYRLRVDPGEYRIEYEPRSGSFLPFATEEQVAVLTSLGREVALPPTVMVEGQVLAADGGPVAAAEVRAFGLSAVGRAVIRGSSSTDGTGRFRMVLPRTAPVSPGGM